MRLCFKMKIAAGSLHPRGKSVEGWHVVSAIPGYHFVACELTGTSASTPTAACSHIEVLQGSLKERSNATVGGGRIQALLWRHFARRCDCDSVVNVDRHVHWWQVNAVRKRTSRQLHIT